MWFWLALTQDPPKGDAVLKALGDDRAGDCGKTVVEWGQLTKEEQHHVT